MNDLVNPINIFLFFIILLSLIIIFSLKEKKVSTKQEKTPPETTAPTTPHGGGHSAPTATPAPKSKLINWAWFILITIVSGIIIYFIFFSPSKKDSTTPQINTTNCITSGSGYTPQELYIDWKKTHTRPQGRVNYVFKKHPSIFITEDGPAEGNSGINEKKAMNMPNGIYIAISEKPVYISWWQ